ncbi:hypothetical protein N7492_001550 [Penicillium capsulatum]|uniref:Uncharacterized protein n=1 Tax=Penicillium capsulatum TaxID=69766 RepID=A0A9W9ITW1_9EURO|nr:hypothetical protein N7492_001550 [Penicillium capsulatum]
MEPSLDPWHFDRVSSMNILIDPASQNGCFESPRASHDASSCSPEDVDVFPAPKESHNFLCGCYKQAVTELERLGLKGRASSMDEILTCQKEWLLQAEAILQCRMCSQSEAQANVLMVLVVAIDSLLSMVDSMAIFSKSGVDEGFNSAGARVKNEPSGRFKPQVEACPLFVGGLRIAADETLCFICQVLKTRLSMMLSMIRRIRGCMQQHLARTSSRGRFLMIIETERRLQLIIMKVKMTAG